MNPLYIEQIDLLTGQQAPATGEWVNIARGRDAFFTAYASGAGAVFLQTKTPFKNLPDAADEGINFYTISGMNNSYGDSAFMTSPMVQVRAVSSGAGRVWANVTLQN
jgi:hypothetical protein